MRGALFLLIALVAVSCNETAPEEPIVAQVGDHYMTLSELSAAIPDDLVAEDSTEMAANIIQTWMTRELMYEKARYNLPGEEADIEGQVEKYRKELFIFAYEKENIRQKLDTVITEEEISTFYDENQDIFQLNDYILKVRYTKLAPNSPDLDDVEEWMRSGKHDDLINLSDYCHRYALKCFYDSNWVYLNELLRELPIEVINKESFLRTGNFVRFNDPEHLYLLYIHDLQSKNTLSPLDLERGRIRNLILNKRKIELLNTIRKSLYRDAIRSGKANVYESPQIPK